MSKKIKSLSGLGGLVYSTDPNFKIETEVNETDTLLPAKQPLRIRLVLRKQPPVPPRRIIVRIEPKRAQRRMLRPHACIAHGADHWLRRHVVVIRRAP